MIPVRSNHASKNTLSLFVLAICAIGLAVPHSAHAAFTFDSQILPGTQFNNPNSVAVDPSSGDIYVVDEADALVEKFTPTGAFIKSFDGTDGGTQFSNPQGIAINSSGDVYVSDINTNIVQEFTSSGVFITSFNGSNGGTTFNYPQGLAVNQSSGHVYVSDEILNTVQEFTSSGAFITSWDGTSGAGGFGSPEGLAIDSSGNVYVTDPGNAMIQEYTSAGIFIQSIDGTDGGTAFGSPTDVAVDSSGNVYVVDMGANTVQEFTSSGAFIRSIDGSNGNLTFNVPTGVAVDSSHNVYVADTNNGFVQKFDSSGGFVANWNGLGINNPQGIALDTSGNIYVINQNDNSVEKFDSSGIPIARWGNLASGGFPQGIAVDSPRNVVYIADGNNGIVEKFDTSGNLITTFDGTNGGTQLSCPEGLAVDPSGNVYVADNCGNLVQEFTSTGAFIKSIDGSNGGEAFGCPAGAAVDPSGDIYVSDDCSQNIQEFTSSGAFVANFGTSSQFGTVLSLFFDPVSSELYASDQGNDLLFIFDQNGNQIAQTGGPAGHTFGNITGAAVDPSGHIYISDSPNNLVEEMHQAASVPTVSSLQPSSITLTSAALNGSISDMGDLPVTARGFSYGTSLSYGATTSESGSFFASEFSRPLSNLSAGTTYHIRAFATNSSGTAYGTDIVFEPYYEFQIAGQGSTSGLYNNPGHMSFDSSNDIYLADGNNNRIDKFDPSGGFITAWGQGPGPLSANGNLNEPVSTAVNLSSGDVYVADFGNNRVQEFDSSGNYIAKWGVSGSIAGDFNDPYDIAIDQSSGDVYVADLNNKRVQEFTSSGGFITSFDGSNGGTAFSVGPSSIAIDSLHNVYVVDGFNASLIQEFTSAGVFVRSIAGSGATAFLEPRGIAIDSSDTIYVSDTSNSRMEKFNSSGVFVSQWADGFSPYAIAVDYSGAVYVSANSSVVDKFIFSPTAPAVITSAVSPVTSPVATLNGSIVGTGGVDPTIRGFVYGLTTAYGATTTEPGSFATSTFSANVSGLAIGKIYHVRAYATNISGTTYGLDKTFITYSQSSFGGAGSGNGVFGTGGYGPQGMAFDSAGDIYVADADNNRVQKFDPSGNYVSQFDGTNGGIAFNSPRDVIIDSSGNIYVADYGNGIIQEFTPSYAFVRSFNGTNGGGTMFGNPSEFAFDTSGNIYVVDGRTCLVQKFTSAGAYLSVQWTSNNCYGGIAISAADDIYIPDQGGNTIQKFDASGSLLTKWGSSGTANGQFSAPTGIAVDVSGNVYVADANNGRIQMFTANGNFITTWLVSGSDPNPTQLAFDPSGNLYLSAYNNGDPLIWKFTFVPSHPTLSTAAASSLSSTGATLNGSITDTGGADATESGFAYGTAADLSAVIATTTLGAETGAASFASSVSSLACGTTYYFRAYATNTAGTGYGSIVSLITSACSSGSNSAPTPIVRKYSGGGSGGGNYVSVIQSVVSTSTATSISAGAPSHIIFTKNLSFGTTNSDVKNLQKFLNAHGFIVAKAGSGSPGNETSYFGSATRAALAAFQKANHIAPAVGYFGPITRAFVAKLEDR